MKPNTHPPRAASGSILAEAMVFILLLAVIASTALMAILGRAVVVERVASTERNRALGQAALNKVQDCLFGLTQAACTNATLNSCGAQSMTIGGKTVTANASWVNNFCRVIIHVPD